MAPPEPSATHIHISTLLGNFIQTWSIIDITLDVVIAKQLGVDPQRGAIVTTGLGFERKISIARSLLQLHDPKFAPTITLLNKITEIARRNILLHGHLHIAHDAIEFIKMDTDQRLTARMVHLEPTKFGSVIDQMIEILEQIHSQLRISDADIDELLSIGKSLTTKSPTSPKPPSRKEP